MDGNPTMLRKLVPVEISAPAAATRSAPVVTNLSIHIDPLAWPFSDCDLDCELDLQRWYRIEKDLCLCKGERKAWLYVELTDLDELTAEDLVVTDITAGVVRPAFCANDSWSRRNGQMFVRREKFTVGLDNAVTVVDVLFGEDAVDPRPRWVLLQSPLLLDAHADKPLPRLTFLRGKAEPIPDSTTQLRVSENGEFKIVQISDMHLTTGVGTCDDAMERDGTRMGLIRADPKTLSFVEAILEKEKPNLVVLGGDQLHHDIDDSQTAIFKVAAPMIARSIPWVVVFGNHDDEGIHALSRAMQMSIYKTLPLCFSASGPKEVDGVGNFYLHVLAPAPSLFPVLTLYFFDSHGQVKREASFYKKLIGAKQYDNITAGQTKWLQESSRANQIARKRHGDGNYRHRSLAFMHIPLPQFADDRKLRILSGQRREPTEGSTEDSGLYDALAEAGIDVLGCAHDHVNDTLAELLHAQPERTGRRPYLAYSGTVGFGGYCSYSGTAYHRRARVYQFTDGRLATWLRVEYQETPVDETVLADGGDCRSTWGTS